MKDSDLKIIVTKGSGPGGQHKNKVESCVTIIHIPTGITERCQETRSKLGNLNLAKSRIKSRLDRLINKKNHDLQNKLRLDAINKGIIRNYNYSRNEVNDYKTNKKVNLKRILNGELNLILKK